MAAEQTPLSTRVVDAPQTLALPTHPAVATWRPARADDIEAILDLERAVASVDHPHWVTTRDEVAEIFALSHIDAERDSLLALSGDGEVLALGTAVMPPGQESIVRSFVLGAVRPDRRGAGIGTILFDWQLGRARQQLASSDKALPGWIMAYAEESVPAAAAMFERNGLVLTRHFFSLERVVEDPVRAFAVPEGVRIVPWSPEWAESARAARNAAFQDHWGSQSTSQESWATMVGGEAFRADLSFLAVAEAEGREQVVAFVLALVNRDDWAGQGFTSTYVQLVGVVREWRGRHLAQALLAEHLLAVRRAGLDRSTLDVDAESPTGALGLYTGMGFVLAHTHMSFVRVY